MTPSNIMISDSGRHSSTLLRYCTLSLLLWSTLVGASLFVALEQLQESITELATTQGREVFRLVEAMRVWNAEHGGILVPQTERDPPNPYLDKSIRSTTTVTGKPLTLLNPAYMTRQISGVIEREAGIRLHLTSLKPINPGNKASAWEARALLEFERGTLKEDFELDKSGDKPMARYMAPLYVKQPCLVCHQKQGYKLGDVRGGLSVQWTVEPLLATMELQRSQTLILHLLVWLLISVLLVGVIRKLLGNLSTIKGSEYALAKANVELEATIEARTDQLLESMQTLKAVSDMAPGVVYQYLKRPDGSTCIPYASERLYDLIGFHPSEVRDDASLAFSRVHPDDVEAINNAQENSIRDQTRWKCEFRVQGADGKERWVLNDSIPVREADGSMLWNGFLTDITERRNSEAIYKQHKIIVDTAQDGFWMTDMQGNLLEVNEAYAHITGYSIAELLKMHISQLEANEQPEDVKKHIDKIIAQGHDLFETRHRHKDGHNIDIEVSATFMREVNYFFVFCRDISQRKKAEQSMRNLAYYDTLTNLPNRRMLSDRLAQAMAVSKRSGRFGALLFLDLDNFKPLNDNHGHEIGDELLIEAARRIKLCVREVDTVARYGGDEFVVLLTELDEDRSTSVEQATAVAEKIRQSLGEVYHISIKLSDEQQQNIEHLCTVSIGVAFFLNHEVSEQDLLKWADKSMYQAKLNGRNQIQFFNEPTKNRES